MATPRQAEQYKRNQAAIVAKAHEALERAWSRLDSDPTKARQEIIDLLTTLINYFGEMSSLQAVEYYDGLRELAAEGRSLPRFRAEMMTAVAMEDVGPSAGWVANAVDEGDRAKALERATAASQRLIQQWGRKTLIGNVRRDPAKPRFARVPHGKTCAFCRLLSSRGAVYYTAETAGSLGQFHAKCDCQIVPSFDGDLPYDPEPYYDEYLTAREKAGGDLRKIVAQMRENANVAPQPK